MNVLSSSPFFSSTSVIAPMPSSTAAIIRARKRISSCSPDCNADKIACDAAPDFIAKLSAHAGLLLITSAGGNMFGVRGNTASR